MGGTTLLPRISGMPSQLSLTGAPNFRDLGGYTTTSGRLVRRRRLFRSDHLGNLAAADLALLSSTLGHNVRVLDLRGAAERLPTPCAIPGATVHSLPIEPTIIQKLSVLLAEGQTLSHQETVALMQDTYRNFVRGNTPRFRSLFQHVLEADDAPLVFHCTAGKDRTGFAAALLLTALGVPQDVVMRDYLLTNARLQGRTPQSSIPPQIHAVLWSVQADFLHAALEAVEQDYGGVEAYLADGLGLGGPERDRLKHLYLDPAVN
jgi:protein-tyrosine phosphatase